MKTILISIALISLPFFSIGQTTNSLNKDTPNTVVSEVKIQTPITEVKTVLKAETKSQILNLNYKKSIDLISIKAYRKSLQIKVKTIKMC